MIRVVKVISGGQTGADRAALDFALEKEIEIGGWVPRGRLAEDGAVSENYPNLRETESADSAERTERNARDADATLILTRNKLKGGSKLTAEMATKHQKPFLHINFDELTMLEAVEKAREFLTKTNCRILKIAGSRASEAAQIYEQTKALLELLRQSNTY